MQLLTYPITGRDLTTDADFMDLALRIAVDAGTRGEVPIGAVVVHEGEVVAFAANRRERDQDPTAHAEVLALRQAGQRLGSWRLNDCTMFVTLEPCPMCMGAALNARLGRLAFACRDPKAGAAVSLFALGNDDRLNHRLIVSEGVRREQASALLSQFFAGLRNPEPADAKPQSLHRLFHGSPIGVVSAELRAEARIAEVNPGAEAA